MCVKACILRILTSIQTTKEFLASNSGIGWLLRFSSIWRYVTE